MKTELWVIGKTTDQYLKTGIDYYSSKLTHYLNFELRIFSSKKTMPKLSPAQYKEIESELVLPFLQQSDFLVLLDEHGKEFTSRGFATFLEKQMLASTKKLVFLVGGAYGFSPSLKDRANVEISLSKMTFSHQMVRLFFVEQLYRAYTILKNEPYHND